MRTLAAANLHAGGRRLLSAGLAIATAVAFVVASLSVVDALERTMAGYAAADARGADLVVDTDPFADAGVLADTRVKERIEALPQVDSVQLIRETYPDVAAGGQTTPIQLTDFPEHDPRPLSEGRAPRTGDEIVLYTETAEAFGVGVGDSVTVMDLEDDEGHPFTVVGLRDGATPFSRGLITEQGYTSLPYEADPASLRIVLTGEAHDDSRAQTEAQREVAEAIAAVTDDEVTAGEGGGLLVGDAQVMTHEQIVRAWTEQVAGDASFMRNLALAFAAIAVFVAALVVMNTFAVLIASRTRTLALMRAIGAGRGQIRGATLFEALVLGVLGSVVGAAAGLALAAVFALWARSGWIGDFAGVVPTTLAIASGLVVGIVTTMVACLIPSRKATSVSPIAALRPVDVIPERRRVSRFRAVAGSFALVAGLALTWFGATAHELLFGLGGAILASLGVMLLCRIVAPRGVRLLGRAGSRVGGGTIGELVAENARQVPGRTSATTLGLIIGVTLVSTLTVGAATAQGSLDDRLTEDYPLDVAAHTADSRIASIVNGDDLVEGSQAIPGAVGRYEVDGEVLEAQVLTADPARVQDVIRSTDHLPDSGVALVGPGLLSPIEDDETGGIRVETAQGSVTVRSELASWLPDGTLLLAPQDAFGLGLDEARGQIWMRLSDDVTTAQIEALAADLRAAGSEVTSGPAMERAGNASIISTLLVVALGLLAAAVVVAVIGIGNTLTLSVGERRREAALLRAVGMDRSGVRWLIVVEALAMAAVAVIVGLSLGVFFGWAGVSSLVADDVLRVTVTVPWAQLGLIVAATSFAAVLASLLPARRLSRTPPAQGLALT